MELMVETGGYIYDITGMCKELSWTDVLNDGASTLEFTYTMDEQVGLIERGAPVRLTDNGQERGIFFGYVFRVDASQEKTVSVKAYDQLRYCKAKDTIVSENDTVDSLVRKMTQFFQMELGENTRSGYILKDRVNTDKTWLDIIYTAISDTLIGTEDYFCLRDEFGKVCLRDLYELQLPLVLGDGSLAYEYSYSASIDDDFYNQVKLVSPNEETGRADVYLTRDSGSIHRYGLLQYYEVLDKNTGHEKAADKAEKLLKLYNREMESLSLSCIGDISVRAGCSVYGSIADINLERRLIVKRVVHTFLPVHTMEVEVMA